MTTPAHIRMARQVLQRAVGDGVDTENYSVDGIAEVVDPDRSVDHNYRMFLTEVVDGEN